MINLTKILLKFNILILMVTTSLPAQTTDEWMENLDEIRNHKELFQHLLRSPNNTVYLPSIFPFQGKSKLSSDYAHRIHPITGEKKFHSGIDFSLRNGSPIIATANGRIFKVGYNKIDGNYIVISHLGGWQSVYCHLSEVKVKPNQLVDQEELIALSGQSGAVTGPHLHYSIKKEGRYYDPIKFCVLQQQINQVLFDRKLNH